MENGTTNVIFGLPQPQEQDLVIIEVSQEEPADFVQMNNRVRRLVDSVLDIVNSIASEDPLQARWFYVVAPVGAGKTFLLNMLMRHLHHNGHQV